MLKCHLKGNWQMDRILIILKKKKKKNGPKASSAPALGLNTIIFKHVYWYMQQISGERLQDHWSSCFSCLSYAPFLSYVPLKTKFENLVCKISQKIFELEPSNLV